MLREDLQQVRDYIQSKLDAEQELPWAVHRYQHLLTLIDGMLESQSTHFSFEAEARAGRRSRRGEPTGASNVVSLEAARRRRNARLQTQRDVPRFWIS